MRALGNFFKALAKGVVFVFIKIHLWAPLAFFALYALICLLIGAKLSEGLPFMIMGLIMSAALSVWLTVRNKSKGSSASYEEGKVNLPKIKLKDELKRGEVLGNDSALAKAAIVKRSQTDEVDPLSRSDSWSESENSITDTANTADEVMDDTYGQYRVFATRLDPTVFVYEYSDRLELVKRTRQGMELMEVRYKESG